MTRFSAIACAPVLALLVLLSACGGSGSAGGAGAGSTPPASYPVGGSIAGLTTGGLALANGGDTVSPAAGATSFTFGTAVTSAATYTVTVKTQPANATCTVSNGAGTMAAAAVTSVQVSCSLNAFQIGGSLSGLTAAGLVLANGTDTTNPAANATSFVFATPVTSGNNYNVSVTQQPTGLNCTLANGGGTASANVSNVAVSCAAAAVGAWSGPVAVGTGVFPLLANDPSGVAFFLAWCHCLGGAADAAAPSQASRYTDAGGWTTPVTMAMTQGFALSGMQFDAQGKGFAVWSAPTGNIDGSVNAMFSRYIPGTGWSFAAMPFAVMLPPLVTPPNSVDYSSFPPLGLSVGSDGTAVALVHQNVQIKSNLGIGTYEDMAALAGGAVPGADVLQIGSSDPLFPSSDTSPATMLDGNGHTISYFANETSWPFDPVTPSTVPGQYATLYTTTNAVPKPQADGSPGLDISTSFGLAMNASSGAAITLATIDNLAGASVIAFPVRVSKASTAIAANGDALTTWSILDGDVSGVTVYAERFISGAWQQRQVVYRDRNANYYLFNALPVAALDGKGNGMIVFNSLGTLLAVQLDATTGAFGAAQVAAPGYMPVSLQMDASGNAFLLDYDGASQGTVRRYDARAGTWSAPGIAFASTSPPVLALDNSGNAMVAWGTGGSIVASRYH